MSKMLTSREVDLDGLYSEGMYTYYTAKGAAERAQSIVASRAVYQAALLRGDEAWSGATLQGAAKKYGARYAASRDTLLARITSGGDLDYLYVRDLRNKSRAHVVVVGRKAAITDDREVALLLSSSLLPTWRLTTDHTGIEIRTPDWRCTIVARGPLMLALRTFDSGAKPCVACGLTVASVLHRMGVMS